MPVYASYRADPSLFSPESARDAEARAGEALERAVRTLNLSEVSRALTPKVGLERALLLKEVLDRVPLPPFDAIPGAATATESGGRQGPAAPSEVVRWTVPHTEITIARVEEGPQERRVSVHPRDRREPSSLLPGSARAPLSGRSIRRLLRVRARRPWTTAAHLVRMDQGPAGLDENRVLGASRLAVDSADARHRARCAVAMVGKSLATLPRRAGRRPNVETLPGASQRDHRCLGRARARRGATQPHWQRAPGCFARDRGGDVPGQRLGGGQLQRRRCRDHHHVAPHFRKGPGRQPVEIRVSPARPSHRSAHHRHRPGGGRRARRAHGGGRRCRWPGGCAGSSADPGELHREPHALCR